jgi:hypothetical protein
MSGIPAYFRTPALKLVTVTVGGQLERFELFHPVQLNRKKAASKSGELSQEWRFTGLLAPSRSLPGLVPAAQPCGHRVSHKWAPDAPGTPAGRDLRAALSHKPASKPARRRISGIRRHARQGGRACEPLLFVRPRSLRLRDERIHAGSRPCSGENTRHLRLGRRLERADDPAPQRRPGSAIR